MSDSQRFPVAAHTLAYLAHKGAFDAAAAAPSAVLAASMPTNPVVMRRVTAMLAKAGLIATRPGVRRRRLAAAAARDHHPGHGAAAVNGCAHLGSPPAGAKGCPVGQHIPRQVAKALTAAEDAAAHALSQHHHRRPAGPEPAVPGRNPAAHARERADRRGPLMLITGASAGHRRGLRAPLCGTRLGPGPDRPPGRQAGGRRRRAARPPRRPGPDHPAGSGRARRRRPSVRRGGGRGPPCRRPDQQCGLQPDRRLPEPVAGRSMRACWR